MMLRQVVVSSDSPWVWVFRLIFAGAMPSAFCAAETLAAWAAGAIAETVAKGAIAAVTAARVRTMLRFIKLILLWESHLGERQKIKNPRRE